MAVPEELFRTTTVSGAEVVIYNIFGGGERPIHGAYLSNREDKVWIPCSWRRDGRVNDGVRASLDLVLPSILESNVSTTKVPTE